MFLGFKNLFVGSLHSKPHGNTLSFSWISCLVLTSSKNLVSDNFMCLPLCLPVSIWHILYIGSRLYFSTSWSLTMARYFSRIVWICKNTASQPTIYVQHNFCPFEFHPLESLTKAGDTVQFFWILVYLRRGKIFHMLILYFYQGHIKKVSFLLGTPARHRHSAKTSYHRRVLF